ncbi:MAG TPA: NfeD family protein [Xanthomonadaceae bacterium]|jgi:membrane protein implicated in regulation of membrane protease activity|nr:NfeD family protein [Xanthomonadaceae bacterium]
MRTELIVWACVSLLLMAAEMIAPGAFMLWLGFAAAGVFLLLLVVPLTAIWQAVAFALLSIVSVTVYWRLFRKSGPRSDQPLLNRRAEQLIGQVYPLDTAIVDGRGRLKIGDAFWAVEGPDTPARTPVRIVSVHDMSLQVVVAAT